MRCAEQPQTLGLSFPVPTESRGFGSPRALWTLSQGTSPHPKLPNSGQAAYMDSLPPALSSYSPSVAVKEQLGTREREASGKAAWRGSGGSVPAW